MIIDRVAALIDQLWGIPDRAAALIDQVWGIPDRAAALIDQVWGFPIELQNCQSSSALLDKFQYFLPTPKN